MREWLVDGRHCYQPRGSYGGSRVLFVDNYRPWFMFRCSASS